MKLLFDVGSNRGDATIAGLQQGYKVVALEPGKVFTQLVKNFIYNPNVVPLKMAVSDTDYERITFYEADEDGLSTINKDWLTDERMPYAGKPYRETQATTITIDELVRLYGEPDLMKIDVEGSEWSVFRGMTKKYGALAFEWTENTIEDHEKQIKYLQELGYTEFAPQFIEHHLQEPDTYYPIGSITLGQWVKENASEWTNDGWKKSGLRPTADVGMLWLR